MNTERDVVIYQFIRIPIPIGVAGASIWAVATFIQRWDPNTYPDLETVFQLPGMQLYTAIVILSLVFFYLYTGFNWFQLMLLQVKIWVAEHRYPPPSGMALIPAGPFQFRLVGKTVQLQDYFIDKYPVTNEQYAEFIRQTNYPSPPSWVDGKYPQHKAKHPVTNVNWDDAQQYCQWRTRKTQLQVRLPTEQEWEKAARGPYGFRYPWGNKFDAQACNVGQGPSGDTNRVDHYPQGISPYHCWDMCGNVWEWTDTWFSAEEDIIVLKGGSYYFDEEFAPLWMRYHDPRTDLWPDLGFRCVVTV
jgi:formylglycine-generating enzyme required for sulfatase activity